MVEGDANRESADPAGVGVEPEEKPAPETSALELIKMGLVKLRPKFKFDTVNMVLGGIGSFILAVVGFWISQQQGVDNTKILNSILYEVRAQGAPLSAEGTQSLTAELEDFLASTSDREAKLLEDAVSDDPDRKARAFKELGRLAQDQVDAIADMSQKAATTYKTIGILNYHNDTQTAVRAFEAAFSLDPDDFESRIFFAELLIRQGDYDAARESLKETVEKAGADQLLWQAGALMNLASISHTLGDFDQALIDWKRSLAMFEELGDALQAAAVNENIGVLEFSLGNYAEARKRYYASFNVYYERENYPSLANVAHNLAETEAKLGNLERAVEYGQTSLGLSKDLGLTLLQARNLASIGVHESMRGNSEIAKDYLTRAISVFEEIGEPDGVARARNSLADIYIGQEAWERALELTLQALETFRSIGKDVGVAVNLERAAAIERIRGNMQSSCSYYQKAATAYIEFGQRDAARNVGEKSMEVCGTEN